MLSLICTLIIVAFQVNKKLFNGIRIIITIVVMFLLTLCNVIVYRIASEHNREIKKTFVRGFELHTMENNDTKQREQLHKIILNNKRIEVRSAVICLSIIVTFALCYCPALIRYTLLLLGRAVVSTTIGPILAIVRYFNSIFDPIIFMLSRRAVIRNICMLLRCRHTEVKKTCEA